MKIFFIIIVVIHGLIHLMGFAKAFKLADLTQLNLPITKRVGMLWFIAAALFLVTVGFLIFLPGYWVVPAAAAVVLSQVLIIMAWADAKFGTIANVIILLPLLISLTGLLPGSFEHTYASEVQKRLKQKAEGSPLTDKDLQGLPVPVKNYLRYVGAVGKPKVENFRALLSGTMKRNKGAGWMDIAVRQYDFYDEPARFFFIESSLYGIPFDGLHEYSGGSATMKIKVASLFSVADARGPEMDQGETVTLFNDMCLLAPSSLIDRRIAWRTIDPLTVEARFTNGKITIAAKLYFNERGALVNFISSDRYFSSDGKSYTLYPWSTPVRGYKELDGRMIPAEGEAIWHMADGEFCYARFHIEEIEYNCSEFK